MVAAETGPNVGAIMSDRMTGIEHLDPYGATKAFSKSRQTNESQRRSEKAQSQVSLVGCFAGRFEF